MKFLEICQFLHVLGFLLLILLLFSRTSDFSEKSSEISSTRANLQVFRGFSQEFFELSPRNAEICDIFQEKTQQNSKIFKKIQRFLLYLLLALVFFAMGGAFRLGILMKIQIF